MAINIQGDQIVSTASKPSIDADYGPYTGSTLQEALNSAESALKYKKSEGKTIGIKVGTSSIIEYWYKFNNNNELSLTEKTTDLSSKQDIITNSNKLDADLVDDANSDNKFVTSSEKTIWNGKQDALTPEQLSNITKGGTALQPSSTLGLLKNDGTVDTETQGKVDNAIQTPSATENDKIPVMRDGSIEWEAKPSNGRDGVDGLSAYEQWLDENDYDASQHDVNEFFEWLKAHISKFIYENYDATAAGDISDIGDAVVSTTDGKIGNTAPLASTKDVILLMPNAASSATATMMFATIETSTQGVYEFVYVGSINDLDASTFVEKSQIVNDLTTGGANKVLSAEAGALLNTKLYGDTSHEILNTTNPVAGTLDSGQWKTNSTYGYWLNAVLPVGAYNGRTLRITPKSTSDGTVYFFAKDNVLISGENVNLCDGTGIERTYTVIDIVIPNDAQYLIVRLTNTNNSEDKTPQSLLVLSVNGDIDNLEAGKVDKVDGKGLSENDYTDADKAKVDTIPAQFVVPDDLEDYVPKLQGIENAGLLLKVGTDGRVTLGTGGGVAPDVTDCVRKEITRTLYLGENILSGIIGGGTGWTENAGNYTHVTGETSPLVFPLATDSGDAYVAILSYSVIGKGDEAVVVSIGDGVPCDIYNGTLGPFYVGMVSDGGNLKIKAVSAYAGTISGIELRKVVTEEDADISVTLDTSNNKHYENVSAGTTSGNITGWWNVAIGATDALMSNQNGSRCIAIGQRALMTMEGGTRNIGIGTFSLCRFVYGNGNIAIGTDAGWYMTGGNDNVIVGKSAFGEIRASNPTSNIAIGKSALSQETWQNPENNVAIGEFALAGGSSSTAKTNCVAIGVSAGRSNSTKCVAIGVNAAFYMMGQGNVAIGYDAMNFYNVDGQNNVCIGHNAKLYPPSRPATIDNAIVIGYNARATKSNQVVIGNANNDEFVLGGKKLVFNNDNNTVSWEAIS